MATRQIPEAVYEHEIAKLSEAYQNAVRDILKELQRINVDGLSKANAAAVLADVSDRLKELNQESADWVKANIPVAATDGVASTIMAIAGVETLEEARKIANFNAANRAMVEAMIADTQQDLLAVTQNVDRRVRNKIREVSGEVMRRNMAAGINGHRTNKAEILRDLRKELGSVLDTGIIDAAGRRWKPHVYADMLVRTKMMRAHMEATTNEALDRGVMYATISSHGATDACRQYEGKIVKLVPEAPGSYPTLAELKASNRIFHPNCKHIVVAIRDPSTYKEPE